MSGTTFAFPSAEWSLFNGSSSLFTRVTPESITYTVTTDGKLDFTTGRDTTESDPQTPYASFAKESAAFQALGISQSATGDQIPVEMTPDANKFRVDNIHARVIFSPTDATTLSIDDLCEMYPSAADIGVIPTGAKLGVFVDSNGYFCVSRARSATPNSQQSSDEDTSFGTEGTSASIVFEYCQTDVPYEAVGGGLVEVRIEFLSYTDTDEAEASTGFKRAFRIWVKKDGAADTDEICLTAGKGYVWTLTPADAYVFDFGSLEEGDWFAAIDNAYVGMLLETHPDAAYDLYSVETLNRLAFSATAGAFYSAWMTTSEASDASTLKTSKLFEGFTETQALFSLYMDWATKYSVDIEEGVYPAPATTFSLLSESESETISSEEYAYNAFLLNMDPRVDVEQRLNVTGLVFGDTEIAMTVAGPEGCDLSNLPASNICVRRAATLDGFATAEAVYYPTPTPSPDGTMVVVLPAEENNAELPFMQVTLVPATETPRIYE